MKNNEHTGWILSYCSLLSTALLFACSGTEDAYSLDFSVKTTEQVQATEQATEQIVGLVVIVDYKDMENAFSSEQVQGYLDASHDYWEDTSFGHVDVRHILRRVTLAGSSSSYTNAANVVSEALAEVDANGFDFSQLTRQESDQTTHEVAIFAPNTNLQTISYSPGYRYVVDGMTIGGYIWVEHPHVEMPGTLFIHEEGHAIFRFPHPYGGSIPHNGTGAYSLMGPNPGRITPRVNPYFMLKQGWISAHEITVEDDGSTIEAFPDEPSVVKFTNPGDEGEYFLIEDLRQRGNRPNTERGLLIWHVDEGAGGASTWSLNVYPQMTPEHHFILSVEQADYHFDLERWSGTDLGDVFPIGTGVAFDDLTYPDANWWDQSNSGLRISEINATDDSASFRFDFVDVQADVDSELHFEVHEGTAQTQALTLSQVSGSDELKYSVLDAHSGFKWTDSDQEGVGFSWEPIEGSGSLVSFQNIGESVVMDLPFPFPYYGHDFEKVTVFAKGCVAFSQIRDLTIAHETFPDLRMGPSVICPMLSDSYPPDEEDTVHVLSEQDRMVIQYTNVRQYEYSREYRSTATFQVILHADGRIQFQYLAFEAPHPYRNVIGLQNATMDRGVTVSDTSTYLHDELSVLLTPVDNYRLAVSNRQGGVAPGSTFELPVTFDASNLAPGDYTDTIEIRLNALNLPNLVRIPVTATVLPQPEEEPECHRRRHRHWRHRHWRNRHWHQLPGYHPKHRHPRMTHSR